MQPRNDWCEAGALAPAEAPRKAGRSAASAIDATASRRVSAPIEPGLIGGKGRCDARSGAPPVLAGGFLGFRHRLCLSNRDWIAERLRANGSVCLVHYLGTPEESWPVTRLVHDGLGYVIHWSKSPLQCRVFSPGKPLQSSFATTALSAASV